MKISRAILSSDDNPMYLPFWPIVADAWRRLDIEPVLFYTGDDRKVVNTEAGKVFYCDKLDLHSAFYAQCIRLLAPAIYPDDICIISDIDMMPLNYRYFQGSVSDYDDDCFITFRPTGVVGLNEISIMYNVASGKIWAEIFDIDNWGDIKSRLLQWYPDDYGVLGIDKINNLLYRMFGWRSGWFTDQKKLYQYLNSWEKQQKVIKLSDAKTQFFRLDRRHDSAFSTTHFRKGDMDRYVDFHMPRPFIKHEAYIRSVFDAYDK